MSKARGRGASSWGARGYCIVFFVLALAVLAYLAWHQKYPPAPTIEEWVFFLLLSVFTITIGYSHPHFGYVSMDRVGQVANILLFGPFWAALINGLASFLFAWSRLWRGGSLERTLNAVMLNTGMMVLMTLLGGYVYLEMGGQVPIRNLDSHIVAAWLTMLLVMQLSNELGILGMTYLSGLSWKAQLSVYATGIELLSGFVGLLVAILYVHEDLAVFMLFVMVLFLGMLVQKKYALMRQELEALVNERTRALQEKTVELEKLATTDPLTGLYNRRYANDFLKREIERCKRYGRSLGIVVADVDHFKNINDRYLHEIGDQVLIHLGQLFQKNCRKSDLVARMGGEEFLFCFPEATFDDVCVIAEKIRKLVECEHWDKMAPGLQVTISMGVAIYENDIHLLQMLSVADKRLYAAKRAGRNQVYCAEP